MKLAQFHIDMTNNVAEELGVKGPWLDPFKGGWGAYFDQFPENVKREWCEINDGKYFFEFCGDVDVICSNPPFSKLHQKRKGGQSVLRQCIVLRPRIISLLMGVLNASIPRHQFMNDNGYYVHSMGKHKWTVVPGDVVETIVWVRSDTEFPMIKAILDLVNYEPSKREQERKRQRVSDECETSKR